MWTSFIGKRKEINMKKLNIMVVTGLAIFIFFFIFMNFDKTSFVFTRFYKKIDQITQEDTSQKQIFTYENEEMLFTFLIQNMSESQKAIYTNFLNSKSPDEIISTGKDILSESQGLFLLYLLNRGMKQEFDQVLDWTMNNLYLSNNTFSWLKRKTGETVKVNALIDDLRIVRALILAHDMWGDARYIHIAEDTSKALKHYNTSNSIPRDFYDSATNLKVDYITLCYLDLYTIRKIAEFDKDWYNIYFHSHEIITNAKIMDTGLYELQYNPEKSSYWSEEEISMILSVYTMLHLAEVGQYDKGGMAWLWKEYEKYNKLYANYCPQTLEPATDIESTALYSLAARLFYQTGDIEKARQLLGESEKFQIKNIDSEIFGSFGNEQTQEVYSFDNLQYLLSASQIYGNK